MRLRPLLALVLLAAAVPARADFAATYNFAPLTGITQSVTPTVTGSPLVGASALVRGLGLTAASASAGFNSSGWTTATSPDATDYLEWSVGGGAGPLAFDSLTFTGHRSATGPLALLVVASADNFATTTPLDLIALADVTVNFRVTIGLSGIAAFQNVSTPVVFRLYGYGAEAGAGTFRLGIDNGESGSTLPNNLIVTGHAVPESGTMILAGMGFVVVAFAARRRLAA